MKSNTLEKTKATEEKQSNAFVHIVSPKQKRKPKTMIYAKDIQAKK